MKSTIQRISESIILDALEIEVNKLNDFFPEKKPMLRTIYKLRQYLEV
ncbi:MAG: hypothetical protein OEV42_21060 [Deltaproteobacteria bacterium]|nr:hypothetical protein [Deltaproteobacteria bacterium]